MERKRKKNFINGFDHGFRFHPQPQIAKRIRTKVSRAFFIASETAFYCLCINFFLAPHNQTVLFLSQYLLI